MEEGRREGAAAAGGGHDDDLQPLHLFHRLDDLGHDPELGKGRHGSNTRDASTPPYGDVVVSDSRMMARWDGCGNPTVVDIGDTPKTGRARPKMMWRGGEDCYY